MTEEHVPGLAEIGAGQTFWDFMLYGNINTVDDMRSWVRDILAHAEKGTDLPFVRDSFGIWSCGRCNALFEHHAKG